MDTGPGSIGLELLLILVLILLNAFFAGSEMAVVSVNKTKISLMAEEGDKRARILLKLLDEPGRFLATIQVGITLAGYLASASAATSIAEILDDALKTIGIPASQEISVIIITLLLSYITLVFGELVPKRIALQNSEKMALTAARPISIVAKLTFAFVKLLTFSTNAVLKLLGFHTENLEEKVSEEEIRSMIQVGEENGVINKIEKDMIDGIFQFDDTLAKEIMTPRPDVFSIEINTPICEVIDQVLEEQYSRVPVYEDDYDNIIGVLYMKDLFVELRDKQREDIVIRNIIRPAYFVPETKNIDSLFRELQSTKNHMAILIDEYGGFSGIVTIEDIIEEVMGNIFDEYDVLDEPVKKLDNNTYMVEGTVPIYEINDMLDIDLPSDDFDTIGGFVMTLLGSIPNEDEHPIVEYENFSFKVEKVAEKRIEKVKILVKEA